MVSIGSMMIFWFGESASCPNAFEIFLGDEVIQRRDVAARDGFRHHLGRLRFGLRQTLARLGVAEGGFAAAFGFEDLRLLGALGAQDRRLALAFGGENLGALLALGLHLPAHGLDQIGRRHDVLDLDAVDLDAPGRRPRHRPRATDAR